MPMTKDTNVLVRRRGKRGRPRKDEKPVKLTCSPVFVARDPQGVKLFSAKPKLSVLGLWDGKLVKDTDAMDARVFVSKFRNAKLPDRGCMLEMKIGI
jgi:hypothetical protein